MNVSTLKNNLSVQDLINTPWPIVLNHLQKSPLEETSEVTAKMIAKYFETTNLKAIEFSLKNILDDGWKIYVWRDYTPTIYMKKKQGGEETYLTTQASSVCACLKKAVKLYDDIFNKKINVCEIRKNLGVAKQTGIPYVHYFYYGDKHKTEEALDGNIDKMVKGLLIGLKLTKNNNKDNPYQVSFKTLQYKVELSFKDIIPPMNLNS